MDGAGVLGKVPQPQKGMGHPARLCGDVGNTARALWVSPAVLSPSPSGAGAPGAGALGVWQSGGVPDARVADAERHAAGV